MIIGSDGPNLMLQHGAPTIRAAREQVRHASFEENIKGSIKAGKLADFVILAKDPHDVAPDTIKEIPVMRTVVGGRTMHLA